MSVPTIQFPVAFEQIPAEVKRLTDFISGCRWNMEVAASMLALVRKGCKHEGAKRGYDEYNGRYMNPCPHCGASE